MSKFMGPGAEHWFGTDNLGRDIFSRILYGGRLTLVVGFGATGIAAVIGTVLGALAGYYGGKIDNVIMRILDVFYGCAKSGTGNCAGCCYGDGDQKAVCLQ